MWKIKIKTFVWWFGIVNVVTSSVIPDNWERSSCPTSCTCQLAHLDDLSIWRWIHESTSLPERDSDSDQAQRSDVHNNVLYGEEEEEEERTPETPLVKSITCLIQADPSELLNSIPNDVQVLTLLQPSGQDENDTLLVPSSKLVHFSELVALELRGNHGNVTLLLDVPLKELRYLNLEGVRLQGMSNFRYDTTEDPTEGFTYIPRSEQGGVSLDLELKRELEVVPYEVYVRKQEENDPLITFSGWESLSVLRIHRCDLHDIQWEMFNGLHNLRHLSLERNGLRFIPNHAFHGTPNLRSLSLSRNEILNSFYRGLAGLMFLEKLDLSYNNFSKLSELSFPPFPNLLTADFRQCPIKKIFPYTFGVMNSTTSLVIGCDDTPLELTPNAFLSLDILEKLILNNVMASILTSDLFNGLTNLKSLTVHGQVSNLEFDAFLQMPNLNSLVLSHSAIEIISMDAFYGLKGLTTLDLSHNKLRSLPPGLFDQQTDLVELYLNNNFMVELPSGIFSKLTSKLIRLTDNPWHCSCAMAEWNPMMTNKIKQKNKRMCHFEYDKGSACSTEQADTYVYENKMSPRCETPIKYQHWSVFHVLRKQIRCANSVKHHQKIDKKVFLKNKNKKYKEYFSSNVTGSDLEETPDQKVSDKTYFDNSLAHLSSEGKLDKLKKLMSKPEQHFQQKMYFNDEINDLAVASEHVQLETDNVSIAQRNQNIIFEESNSNAELLSFKKKQQTGKFKKMTV